MTGSSKYHTGARKQRARTTPAVAPVTRAIRAALAMSATMLVLSAPAFAAGTCSHDSAPNYACDAAFFQSTFQSMQDAAPVDLTRVDGNDHPSSVFASMATAANDSWSIGATSITAGYADALLADAMGVDDVTMVADGDFAFAASTGFSFGAGDIAMLTEINNTTDTDVSGYGGNVRGVYAFDDVVTIVNSASITAEAVPFSAGGYAQAIGVRAAGYDVEVHNEIDGFIGAMAISDGGRARARGVYATGYFEGLTVNNEGDIQAYARANDSYGTAYAFGVYAFGYGSETNVYNAGDIEASAQADGRYGFGLATGINSIGYGQGDNNAVVANSGSINAEANATYAYAFGALNLTRQRYGDAYFTNEGDIHAEATGALATASGVLNLTLRYGDSTTTNTGTIEAVANGVYGGSATGIFSYANVYNASLDNSGTVSATATGDIAIATGIHTYTSLYGGTTILNSGDVTAHAYAGAGFAEAVGVLGESERTVAVTNYGNVDVIARSVDDMAVALGMYVSGAETTTLLNYGSISALAESAYGDARAYGAFEYAGWAGIGLVINGGEIHAEASAGAGAQAHATGINVIGDVVSIFNDGNASATATAGDGGLADARAARSYGLNTAVSNYGSLTASATADGGTATATGAESYAYTSSSIYNAGDIQAVANADGGYAAATGAYSLGIIFGAYTTNTGTISAEASGASAVAQGALNAAVYLGDAITINDGSITAVAEGTVAPYGVEEAIATGVYNFAMYYDSIVDNRGSISATALAMEDISGTDGFLQAKAVGVNALAAYGYGETTIINTGDILASAGTSQGYASAWGAVARAGMYGSVAIENDGLIAADASTDIGVASALGAYVLSVAGTAQVVNNGDIVATTRAERGIVNVTVNYADATALRVISVPYGAGEAIVDNYGNIEAHSSILGGIGYATGVEAYGQYTSLHNAAGANIIATVDAELFGGAFATAVEVGGMYGVDIVNDGAIVAYGHANAHSEGTNGFYGAAGAAGIYVNASYKGDAMVANNGDINAIAIAENSVRWAQGGAGATGVNAYAKYDASIVNAGDINAIADAQFGIVAAYGAVARGKYSSHIVNEAGASIVASASVGSLAGDQYAGRAVSFGTQIFKQGMDYAVTYNAGSIVSHALVTPDGTGAAIGSIATAFGSSIGYNSAVLRGEVDNVGSIEAAASADFGYATAYGAFVLTDYDALITNAGDIQAGASATGGNAFAVGSYVKALHQIVTYNCDTNGCDYANPIIEVDAGDSLIDNSGDIIAAASALGGVGYSYGAVALGAFTADISNAGHISAHTDADDALAVGSLANSFYGDARLQNSGTIGAVARGDIANATGAIALGYNGVVVDNTGTIVAGAYGADATATAISMESNGSNVLINTGTIAALGDGERIAIASGTGATSIANSGSITGAILTGGLDDSFDNAAGARWNAVGESDFGAGDDHIVNNGTIFMADATIRLGGYVNGNTFDNFGLIAVSGSNVLDMDNPFPVYNNGTISFVDGAPDDTLTIIGDFAGDGALNLDVSALNQASDRLYVDGSVIESTTQTINVNLVDAPNAPSMDIPLVSVSGNAAAGDFVLGNVSYAAGGFLTLVFGLDASIDSTNTSDDLYSLRVEATGLNGTGLLATAVAPGAQSLVDAQIGTWRQRMGVVPRQGGDAGVAPWMRVFSGSGDVELGHRSNFGAGGDFGFDQSNHGWELGLDTRPGEHFAFGVLIAKSEGSQHLGAGAGSDRFDGKSFGIYGTWLGDNGFYLDASQRWTGVDARLRSATGEHRTEVTADSFNVEAGFTAWTLVGVNVVPQVQYTHTRVGDIAPVRDGDSTFVSDGGVSSRGRLGVAFDKSFQSSGFTLTPYGSLNLVREFEGEYDYSVNDGLLGSTRTEGTSAMFELGLGARKGGLSVTGGMSWTDGGAQQGVTGGQLVVRYGW
jgi:outer membrane autotransporter protein